MKLFNADNVEMAVLLIISVLSNIAIGINKALETYKKQKAKRNDPNFQVQKSMKKSDKIKNKHSKVIKKQNAKLTKLGLPLIDNQQVNT